MTPPRAAALVATSALAAAGCGAPPAPARAPLGNASPAVDAYLVWTQADTGEPTTRWIDAGGRVVATAPGIVIADGGDLWRVTTRAVSARLRTCEQLDHETHDPPAGEPSDGKLLALVRARDGASVALNTEIPHEGLAELDWGAIVMASAGPYVFVEDYQEAFACGAHGDNVSGAHVVDLDRRGPIAPLATDAALIAGSPLAAAARAALPATDDGFDDTLHVGEVVPAWTHGDLEGRYLVWKDTCYACSTGDWSSYTAAAWVDGPVPPAVAALPPVPRAVTAHAAGQARAGVSWGHADASWRRVFN